jgi:hypothetical protein
MAQPKKVSFQEKQRRKLVAEINAHGAELLKLKKAMKNQPEEMDTWRWAVLEIFKQLRQYGKEADDMREAALQLARNAQVAINSR